MKLKERNDFAQKYPALKHQRSIDYVVMIYVLRSLTTHDFNRTYTAEALGISIRTLRNYLNSYKKMGIAVPDAMVGPGLNYLEKIHANNLT